MKPELQRIAIAKACGWKKHPLQDIFYYLPTWHGKFTATDPMQDLDAMHEAEKIISLNEIEKYKLHLIESCNRGNPIRFFWQATAAQRAEAFLRTLNLWLEEPTK